MVDYLTILPLFNLKPNKIFIYGDKTQIGIINTSQTFGKKALNNLFDYAASYE